MLSADEASEAAPGKREAFSAAAAPAILAGCINERLRRKRTQPWTSHLPIAAVDGAVEHMNLTADVACVESAADTQPVTQVTSTQPITPSSQPQDSQQQYERDEQRRIGERICRDAKCLCASKKYRGALHSRTVF